MRIGIDISQLAYPGTGVASYLQHLVEELVHQDNGNEYILFYSSMRKQCPMSNVQYPMSNNVKIKSFKFPPTFLNILWNKLHIVPIEWFVGPLDVFISSDWVEPPSKAKKITILYDLIVYKYPQETAQKIVEVQKKKLEWVKKEVDKVICISDATKKDAMNILGISESKLEVVYPGVA